MNDIINNEEPSLNDEDFVFTQSVDKETGDTVIMGGGYKVESFFLKQGIPVMKQHTDDNQEQSGGKVSSPFESLAVPAGLFYINQKVPKNPYRNSPNNPIHFKQQSFVSDDLLDKLYALVSADKVTDKATSNTTNTNKKGTRRKLSNATTTGKKTRRQIRGTK